MPKNIFIFSLFAAATLTGCASNAPKLTPEMKAAYEKPLICNGKQQCDLYWQRATFYVNSNSKYKIQTANENIIATYTPTGGTTNLGYNISREPMGNDAFRIWVSVACDNMFGCYPSVPDEIIKFKQYVSKP